MQSHFLSISTGPNHVLKASETVYYEIPAGREVGETMMIEAVTSQGQMSMGKYVGVIQSYCVK